MSITDGIGEYWGSFLVHQHGFLWRIKKYIKTIVRKIFRQYYDVVFKIPVEKLSVIKHQNKEIDISQLRFEKSKLDKLAEQMTFEDMIRFYKKKN